MGNMPSQNLPDLDDEARPYFLKAYVLLIADPWLAENDLTRLERLKSLSEG
jgi:hypothetical protein